MNSLKVALFGGSFDPPHFGHRAIIDSALRELSIDRLIIIPTFLNPFKSKSHLSAKERLAIAKEYFSSFKSVEISDYEIEQGVATPTAKTLRYFQNIYSVRYIIIGADNLSSIDKWYNFRWLNSQITWVVATRDGYKLDSSKLKDFKILKVDANISSTEIRNKRKESYMTLNDRVERIVDELDKKKGEEIEVFNLDEVDYIAKRVILVTSLSGKHAFSLSAHLKDELKPLGEEFLRVDESEDWIVIDMGDILIHILSPEYRQKYSLEDFLTDITNRKDS